MPACPNCHKSPLPMGCRTSPTLGTWVHYYYYFIIIIIKYTADILASNWLCGKPAAFDLTVVSPLNPTLISEAGHTAGSAAVAAELRKHSANDAKCSELGWTCIPLVAESYGAWGNEAMQAFSRLASYLATRTNSPKSNVVCSLYGRLNLTLVRANARALLLRCGCSLQEGDSSSLSLS